MDAEMSEIGGVKRLNEAISGDDFLGKKKLKEELATSPNSPLKHDFEMIIIQPYFLKKEGGEEEEAITHGNMIVEVFELRVKSGKKEHSRIHGTVRVDCGTFGRTHLFERSENNPQHVHCKESLELTGPTIALCAMDRIYVYVELMEGADELVNEWSLIFYKTVDNIHSIFQKATINSSVKWKLSYVIYKEAAVGTVEIKLKPTSSVRVCGSIQACSTMYPDWANFLFSKESSAGQYHSIEKNLEEDYVLLPLLRSVAAVPLSSRPLYEFSDGTGGYNKRPVDGCLLIEVDLVNMDDGGKIAKGVLEFKVGNYGDYVGTISSEYGELQVKVSFICLYDHVRDYLPF